MQYGKSYFSEPVYIDSENPGQIKVSDQRIRFGTYPGFSGVDGFLDQANSLPQWNYLDREVIPIITDNLFKH